MTPSSADYLVVRLWPGRDLVFVAASSSGVLEWLHQVRRLPSARLITGLRLEAAVDDPPLHANRGDSADPG
jgi:hypothetical protein